MFASYLVATEQSVEAFCLPQMQSEHELDTEEGVHVRKDASGQDAELHEQIDRIGPLGT